ncbi:MAG: hypothetical protein ACRDV4_09200 [Acidimicrobiales bacterium]
MKPAGLVRRSSSALGRLSSWWRLVALCVGTNLAEAALVMGFDHGTRPDLAPQASAVAPFGVFGDLRWVSVYHDSWAGFAAEIAAMLVVRAAITCASVSLAWPTQMERPTTARLFARAMLATSLSALLLAPSVALLFGLAAVPVSWLFLAAVPAALLVAMVVHPVAVSGDWWRRSLTARALGWVLLAFFVLSASAAAMSAVPAALWPLVSALSGLFNAWSWVGLVHAVSDRRPARHVVPVVPVALVALVCGVTAGAVLGFSHAHPHDAGGSDADDADRGSQPVLLVSGYGSTWDGRARHPIPGDFYEQQFSYAGTDSAGVPRPYTSSDTVKPLPELEEMFVAQLRELSRRGGRKVDVVAESEGALVSKTALLADPAQPVSRLVLASPLIAPGRVWYPSRDAEGWGVASAAGMRLLGGAFQSVSPISLDPDSSFLESLDRFAPDLETAMTCPLRGVRQFALLPLADATVTPAGATLQFSSVVVDAFHGGLLESRPDERIVSEVLDGRPVGGDGLLQWADDVISSASGAWQVPALVDSDYPTGPGTGVLTGATSCSRVATELHAGTVRG